MKVLGVLCAILSILPWISAAHNPYGGNMVEADPSEMITFANKQLHATAEQVTSLTQYPGSGQCTHPDTCHWGTVGAGSWICGFYVSALWAIYNNSRSQNASSEVLEFWHNQATSRMAGLKDLESDTGTHDVGLMMFYTYGHAYEITLNNSYKEVTLKAAASLATRFSPVVGCTRSWDRKNKTEFWVIIDNMMNLELLLWAGQQQSEAEQNGQPLRVEQNYTAMAISHADHMIRDDVRADGCTYHVIIYDSQTGEVLRKTNHPQGLYDNSTWARGQAWAVYGFTMIYRYTRLQRYLDMARNLSGCFLRHLHSCCNTTHVPLWDFSAHPPMNKSDSSAGAIFASAMIELSHHLQIIDPEASAYYMSEGKWVIDGLSTQEFLSEPGKSDSILLHGVGSYPSSEVDVPLIYGDYYYTEAMLRLLKWFPGKTF